MDWLTLLRAFWDLTGYAVVGAALLTCVTWAYVRATEGRGRSRWQ